MDDGMRQTQSSLGNPNLVFPTAELIAEVQGIYETGRILDAYQRARVLGEFHLWRGTEAILLAGRITNQTGAPRVSDRLDLRAWRADADHPGAALAYVGYLCGYKGPLAAWNQLKTLNPANYPKRERFRYWTWRAYITGLLRDFTAAEKELTQAASVDYDPALLLAEEARLEAARDNHPHAVAAAKKALSIRPWQPLALDMAVASLRSLNRTEEALELLQGALPNVQLLSVASHLFGIYKSQDNQDELAKILDLYEKWAPLLEKNGRSWLIGARADNCYRRGDFTGAIEWAGKHDSDYYKEFAQRLRDNAQTYRRKRLAVPFIRQHHLTCAPASMAAVAAYWGKSVSHEQIADEICYSGTSDYLERVWARKNGFILREFTGEWAAICAAIDHDLPIMLTTKFPGGGHLQTIVGYDFLGELVEVNDPGELSLQEYRFEPLKKDNASTGPRCVLMVPQEKAACMEGLELPDAELYEILFEFRSALEIHDRATADRHLQRIKAVAPGHRLSLRAAWDLAAYDRDDGAQLAIVSELCKLYPDDESLELARLNILRSLGRHGERLAALEERCRSRKSHPAFWIELAMDLSRDKRKEDRARKMLWKAHARGQREASVVRQIADLEWGKNNPVAAEFYRFAVSLEPSHEGNAFSYFLATRFTNQVNESLAFLRKRFEQHAHKSQWPGRTLYRALDQMEYGNEALVALDQSIAKRPDDGALLWFAADCHLKIGQRKRGLELLAAAEKAGAYAPDISRTRGRLARTEADREQSLAHWQDVLKAEPQAQDAHDEIADCLCELHSAERARDFLGEAVAKYPDNAELLQLLLNRADGNAEQGEKLARRLIELEPHEVGHYWELSRLLRNSGRKEEALEIAKVGIELSPRNTRAHQCLADALDALGKTVEATAALRRAVEFDIDNDSAIEHLFELAKTEDEKRQTLDLVRKEIDRQPVLGDGLYAFRQGAQSLLGPEEILAVLERKCDERPDLWQRWSVLIYHLYEMNRYEEAVEQANEALQRFPLVSSLHMRKADALRELELYDQSINSAEQAHLLHPYWTQPMRKLAANYRSQKEYRKMLAIAQEGLKRHPKEYRFAGLIAEAYKLMEEKEKSIQALKEAVSINPGYDWAWDRLRDMEERELVLQTARELTAAQSKNSEAWQALAKVLDQPHELEESLQAIDKAVQFDPKFSDLHDFKATRLAEADRYEEALAACKPPVYSDGPPFYLEARAAWIEARRNNIDVAIRAMKKVVTDHPDHFWGWRNLAEWLRRENRYEETLGATDNMVRIEPQDALAWAYRGDAHLLLKHRDEAKKNLYEAIRLSPGYEWAASTLFQIVLDDRLWDEAKAVLELMRKKVNRPIVLWCEYRFHARQKHRTESMELLRELCLVPPDVHCYVKEALDEWSVIGSANEAEAILEQALDQGHAHPHVGACWVESWRKRHADRRRRLLRLNLENEACQRALVVYIESLDNRRDWLPLFIMRTRYRSIVRRTTRAWAAVGYALVASARYPTAIRWLRDWKSRTHVRPCMLFNYVIACLRLRKNKMATEAVDAAVKLESDHTSEQLCFWNAYLLAASGQIDAATTALKSLPKSSTEPNKFVQRLAQCLVDVSIASDADKASVFKRYKAELAELRFSSNEVRADIIRKVCWNDTLRIAAKESCCYFSYLRSFLPHLETPSHSGSRLGFIFLIWVFLAMLRSCSGS